MQVSVFQCSAGGLSPQQRLQRLSENIADQQLDLVVCPELFMSGYNIGQSLVNLAQPAGGEFSEAIAEIALSNHTAIVYGYPEKTDTGIFNSALCIDKNGQLIANHRKLLLPPGFEQQYFQSGQKTGLFELNGVQCSMLVCYDVEYPEAVRALAEAGAELIIVPTALGEEWGFVANKLVPTRAFENGAWLIYANHAGIEQGKAYLGHSCIVRPDGSDAARAGSQETLITASLNLDELHLARERLPYLKDVSSLRNSLK